MLFIAELRNEHDMLLALADQLERATSGSQPDALTPLLVLLERFNQLLQIHLLREDTFLYPALIAGDDVEAANVAACFQAELGLLGSHVLEFDQKWSTTEISRSWLEFRQDIMKLVEELRFRIERENEDLYPLAERFPKLAA